MPEEQGNQRRRLPSLPRRVSELRASDMRVSVIGTVLDRAEDGLVLDDGTGKIDVTLEGPPGTEQGSLIRVLGRVVPLESGFQLQGEIVQDMKGLDMELLNRVRELKV